MKIQINRDRLIKFGSIIIAGFILVEGGILINNLLEKKEEKYPYLKDITKLSTSIDTKMTYNGINYEAPDNYVLEVRNGTVYAVRKYFLIEKQNKPIEEYDLSIYTVVDGLVYSEKEELMEPIINGKSLKK